MAFRLFAELIDAKLVFPGSVGGHSQVYGLLPCCLRGLLFSLFLPGQGQDKQPFSSLSRNGNRLLYLSDRRGCHTGAIKAQGQRRLSFGPVFANALLYPLQGRLQKRKCIPPFPQKIGSKSDLIHREVQKIAGRLVRAEITETNYLTQSTGGAYSRSFLHCTLELDGKHKAIQVSKTA